MASIRERTTKQGETTWNVAFRHGGKQLSRAFASPEKAAEFKALVDILKPAKALAILDEGGEPDGITVDELFEKYVEWKKTDVTGRTIGDYKRDYANWIKKDLGHRHASTIDEEDVQKVVDKMAKKLDAKTVADKHMLIHSMFKFGAAKSRRLVGHNPCLETQLPKRKKKPPKGATIAEWQAIEAAAFKVDKDAAELLQFLVTSGWRFSEATALLALEIEEYQDEEHGVWRMYATMGRVTRKDEKGRPIIAEDEGKSDAAIRRTKMTPAAAAMIRRRLIGKGPLDLVFTNSRGAKWYQQNFLNRTWTKILAEAGLEDRKMKDARGRLVRVTPHWLRHTHVALLSRTGVPLEQMKARLGHEDVQTTINVYGGMISDVSDDALEQVDRILKARPAVRGEVVEGAVVPQELG